MLEGLSDLDVDCGRHVGSDQVCDGNEGGAHLKDVGGRQIPLHLVDQHESELVLWTEACSADEVARLLVDNAGRRGELHGLDVSEGAIVAQHLYVQEADQELLRLFLISSQCVLWAWTGGAIGRRRLAGRSLHLLLEDLDLPGDDPVLLLLGFGLTDPLEELEELLRQVHSRHGCVIGGAAPLRWVVLGPLKLSGGTGAVAGGQT